MKVKVNGNTKRNHACFTQADRTPLSLSPLETGHGVGGSTGTESLEKQQANRKLIQSYRQGFVLCDASCTVLWQSSGARRWLWAASPCLRHITQVCKRALMFQGVSIAERLPPQRFPVTYSMSPGVLDTMNCVTT